MFNHLNRYLAYQGHKYIKPEKAGDQAQDMLTLRTLAQAARQEFQILTQDLAAQLPGFSAERVSQWMNQAQVCRPHFWSYFRAQESAPEAVSLAIRVAGVQDDFAISAEVSFVERKRQDGTLALQNQVLQVPISAPCYYWVQENGESYRVEGTEENRQRLFAQVASGQVRKVLVKIDVAVTPQTTNETLVSALVAAFEMLMPYYQAAQAEVAT